MRRIYLFSGAACQSASGVAQSISLFRSPRQNMQRAMCPLFSLLIFFDESGTPKKFFIFLMIKNEKLFLLTVRNCECVAKKYLTGISNAIKVRLWYCCGVVS
jgi:hypothetical protein